SDDLGGQPRSLSPGRRDRRNAGSRCRVRVRDPTSLAANRRPVGDEELTMKYFLFASLAVALVATVLLITIGGPTYLPPMPPRPAGVPLLVAEPAGPDVKLPP